jgi:hypothetical protein
MYPQCRFKAVKATVQYYASHLEPLKQEQICKCLDILKFGMGNTIVSFLNKYYEYSIDPDPDRRRLTIEGFKSAFLADLEATYIFDKLNHLLARHVHFIGAYQDDKIIIFHGKHSNEWLSNWLCTFKCKTDHLLDTVDIQFTMEIWSPGKMTMTHSESARTVPGIGTFNQ